MKKLIIAAILVILTFSMNAQRFAYIDTKYILDNIPEYESAQKQLSIITTEWQDEIEALYADIEKLYKEYEVEKVIFER
jgi:outer membrane protein